MKLTNNAKILLETRYFQPGESWPKLAKRVAKAIARGEKTDHLKKKSADQFASIIETGEFIPATPFMMNAGGSEHYFSCYVLPIGDSLVKIYQTVADAAKIFQLAGGCGYSFSGLRPAGCKTSKNPLGGSSGPISFMRVYDASCKELKQGGCIVEGTRITLADGSRIKIEELCPGEMIAPLTNTPLNIQVVNDLEGPKETATFFNNGVSDVIKLTTIKGFEFTATPNHKIRVIDSEGEYTWKELKDIIKGDWIGLKGNTSQISNDQKLLPPISTYRSGHGNENDCKVPMSWSPEFAQFLGFWFGDGFYADGGLGFSISNDEIYDTYAALGHKLFNIPSKKGEARDGDNSWFLNFYSRALLKWVKEGLKLSHNNIPEEIQSGSSEIQNAFIRGWFDADGSISKDGYPSISSCREQVIKDAQKILLSCGIVSTSSSCIRANAFAESTQYQLVISEDRSRHRYYNNIGFTQIDLTSRFNFSDKHHNTTDILPNQSKKIKNMYPEQLAGTWMQKWERGELVFDQIKSIEYDQAQTYDIEVPDTHTYIADGWISHNSRKGAQMGVLRIDHPDVEEFIDAKLDLTQLTQFNVSCAITDDFMKAVKNDDEFELIFPGHDEMDKTVKARDLWKKIVYNAWKMGDPGLIFIDEINRKDTMGGIEATNPCAEQPLPPYSCCDLGSIDLAKLINKKGEFDWDRYSEIIHIAVRFLDNAIDGNTYTLPEIEAQQKGERRIGLGIMGFADALIELGMSYDSDEARHWAESIAIKLKEETQLVSEALAVEKGAFPFQPKSKIADATPIRNCMLTTIAPTGCLVPSTRVYSNKGCPKIGDLPFSEKAKTFTDIDSFYVSTDTGNEACTKTYNNGIASTIKIITKRGFELEGTETHQIRIINNKDEYVWKTLKELQIGDFPCLAKGTAYDFTRPDIRLNPIEKLHFNADPDTLLPKTLTADVAYILGFFIGDGNFTSEGIRFAFNVDEPDEICRVNKIVNNIFGLSFWGATEPIGKGICYCLNSKPVKRWIHQFGLVNTETKLQIPQQIWDSSAQVKGAFLRGLYDADGSASVSSRNVELSSHHPQFLKEIQRLILDLGIVSGYNSWTRDQSCFSTGVMYKISISHQADIIQFKHIIGFEHTAKQQALSEIMQTYTTSPRKYSNQPNLPKKLDASRIYVDKIISIEYGESQTYDIEVPKGNTYIANGFVSHNSISIIAGCSSGIEPIYALVFRRKHDLPGHPELIDVNQAFQKVAIERGFYSETLIDELIKNNGSCQGISTVPGDVQKIFKVSADLFPSDHVKMLATWQEHIQSGVSKTINLSEHATVEDVEKVYWQAYESKCKGITVFRDKCRGGVQVLNTGSEEVEVKGRPQIVAGQTMSVNTALGKMYVTVNNVQNGDGDKPFEVFIHLAKGGTNAQADSEAIARLISLALRSKVGVTEVVSQLKGIGSGASAFEKGRVISSIPDAAAYVLEYLFLDKSEKVDHPDDREKYFPSGTGGDICLDCG